MLKSLSVLALLIFALLFPVILSAQTQQDTIKSRIETIDGNEYIGVIEEQNADKIRLRTDKLGEITILTTDIKKISRVTLTQAKDGTYWLDNPQSTRYFWSPNGYSLKKGEGYYQNVWILGNQAVYGLTKHLSA